MPPPVREQRTAPAFGQVHEADVPWYTREGREAREAEVKEWITEYIGGPPGPDELQPELVIHRATNLLACICVLCLVRPDETSQSITNILRFFFPDISLNARDVEDIFRATWRNRAAWVRDMRFHNELHQPVIRRDLIELLRLNVSAFLARMPHRPLRPNHDGRDGIRFLEDLVGVPTGEVNE